MTDLLEQRLVAAGRRWQAEQPPLPVVPLDRLDQRLDPRRPRRAVVAAAAAVVLVAVGTAVVRLHDAGSSAPPGDATSPGTVRTPAGVVPWRPLEPANPRVVRPGPGSHRASPYDDVIATGEISGHYHPGDTLVFTVTLESFHDIVLDPCPTYDVAFGAHAFHVWRLNCAEVPTRLGSRPYLPADTKIRFEMRVPVPDVTGEQKVLWTLEGPHAMPGFYGLVRVDPRP